MEIKAWRSMEREEKTSNIWCSMECSNVWGQWKEKKKHPMFGVQGNVPMLRG
jgi:hypothetical protein